MENESSDLCAICLQPVSNSSIRTKCSHFFHTRCLNDYRLCKDSKWKSCSLCRQVLSSEDVLALIEKQNQCEICSNPFNKQNPLYSLTCGHHFHFICLITKLRSQKLQTCCVCQTEYPEGVIKNADYNYKLAMGYL